MVRNPVVGSMANVSSRRLFLQAATVAAAAGLGAGPAGAQAQSTVPERRGSAFKISLAQWSLHTEIFAGRLDPLDFARVASSFGVDAVEYVNQFYFDKAKDRSYLAELKRRAVGEGVWGVLVMVDREGDVGAPDPKQRAQVVENHKKWIDAAAFLGCHAIRVNARSTGSGDEQAQYVVDGLRRLAEAGERAGINVLVENHGGWSSNGGWLADVMRAVDHPRCGTLPDFGNFTLADGSGYDRYQGVRELMPYAKSVSAKSYDFDERGNETTINFLQMMKIVTDAGYRGYVGVEYEGKRLDEYAGIERTLTLLRRVRTELESRGRRR